MSLPLRECGLKYRNQPGDYLRAFVTPLAGVWVEIIYLHQFLKREGVTPLAGVWVEIINVKFASNHALVTPLAGVWVEIYRTIPGIFWGICHSPCGSVG